MKIADFCIKHKVTTILAFVMAVIFGVMSLIADFCIKHKVTTILAFVMAVIFGVMSFGALPLALMPDIELPMAIVMTTYAGAGPEEIENLVTEPIESACASVAGMDELQSQSSENMSIVMVTFTEDTDMDQALVDMREKIDLAKSMLPEDASAPTVMKMNMDSMPVMMIGLKGSDLAQMQTVAEDDIAPRLERIDGVASVDIMGGYQNEVAIEAYNDRLEGYGISLSYIGQMLGADNVAMPAGDMQNGTRSGYQNEVAIEAYNDRLEGYGISLSYIGQMLGADNVAMPAGDMQNGTRSLSVRADGEYKSVEDVENTLIPLPNGGTVRLGELAKVSMSAKDQDSIAKVDGEPCLMISVTQQSGTNTVQVAERTQRAMEKLGEENPTLNYMVLMDQSEYINQSVDSVMQNIILGVVFAAIVLLLFLRDLGATAVISVSMPAAIVLLLFLRDLGATAVISVSMPVCIVSVFLIMRALGITMNMMSLGGLAMGVGMIVDNSIVVLVISVSMPVCIVSVFLIMRALGITMNMMSLGGLAMGVGMIVDNSIVVLENIFRFRSEGFSRWDSCTKGTAEVSLSISASTLTTVAVFSGGSSVTLMLVDLEDRDRSATEIANELRGNLQDIADCEISVSAAQSMSMSGDAVSLSLSGNDYDELVQAGDELVSRISALPDAIEVKSSAADEEPRVSVKINRENASRFGLTAARNMTSPCAATTARAQAWMRSKPCRFRPRPAARYRSDWLQTSAPNWRRRPLCATIRAVPSPSLAPAFRMMRLV